MMTVEAKIIVEIVGQLCPAFGYRGAGSLVLKRGIASGTTILELLHDLAREYPGFADQAFLPEGRLSGAVALVLNGAFLTSELDLHDILKDGYSIVLVPQMVGG